MATPTFLFRLIRISLCLFPLSVSVCLCQWSKFPVDRREADLAFNLLSQCVSWRVQTAVLLLLRGVCTDCAHLVPLRDLLVCRANTIPSDNSFVYPSPSEIHCVLSCQACACLSPSSPCSSPLSVFCTTGFMGMDCFGLRLLGKVLICPSTLENNFAGCSNLSGQSFCFLFQRLKHISLCSSVLKGLCWEDLLLLW